MAILKLYYLLNGKGRKDSLLNGGNGRRVQVLETELTKENSSFAEISDSGEAFASVGFNKSIYYLSEDVTNIEVREYDRIDISFDGYEINRSNEVVEKITSKVFEFSKVMTADELVFWELNRVANLKRSKENYAELKAALELKACNLEEEDKQKKIEREKLEKEEKERKVKLRELQEQKRAEDEKARLSWISKNGSTHLKDLVELKYEYKRKFIEEYIEKELPGFSVGNESYFCDNTSKKCSPSEDAIEELKELMNTYDNVEILWDSEEECETILIVFQNYYIYKEL